MSGRTLPMERLQDLVSLDCMLLIIAVAIHLNMAFLASRTFL